MCGENIESRYKFIALKKSGAEGGHQANIWSLYKYIRI